MFRKIIKWCGYVLVAAVTGAIGSGVWEKILWPLLKFLSDFVTDILKGISQDYSDSIYKSAANLVEYSDDKSVVLMIFILFICMLVIGMLFKKMDLEISGYEAGISFQKKIVNAYFWAAFVCFVIALFPVAKSISIQEVRIYSTHNLEVVRPYVGEHQYLMMRSKFLQMKSESDFADFLSDLYSRSEASNIKIEKFYESSWWQ